MVGLVQLLLKSNASNSLIEDYAACLELRSEELQNLENNNDDPGILIMQVCLHSCHLFILFLLVYNLPKIVFTSPSICFQLLIDNISRPAPNITHLLLKFDLDTPIERTVLQPKFYYRFLSIIWWCLISWFLKIQLCPYNVICILQLHEGYSWYPGKAFEAWCKCITMDLVFWSDVFDLVRIIFNMVELICFFIVLHCSLSFTLFLKGILTFYIMQLLMNCV